MSADASHSVHKLNFRAQNTRRNLPREVSRKRGEANFLRAFERAYYARTASLGFAADEFSLGKYGVADLIWIGCSAGSDSGEFTAYSIEKRLKRRQLYAFEAKLKDWRRALQQAFRYRYYSDKAIVVMPYDAIGPGLKNLAAFQAQHVGLWSFEKSTGKIREHYTPTRVKALNRSAREKAIALISSKVNLRKLSEQL